MPNVYEWMYLYLYQARSQGGGSGGSYDPPQLPIPKILFHPLAILFHLSAILFHPSAILFHPSAILFHPLAILFHPWNMDDVTWAMSKGGGACECPRVGAFFKLMTSRGQCPRGGAPGVPPIQVQTPPTWLAGYGPVYHVSDLVSRETTFCGVASTKLWRQRPRIYLASSTPICFTMMAFSRSWWFLVLHTSPLVFLCQWPLKVHRQFPKLTSHHQ